MNQLWQKILPPDEPEGDFLDFYAKVNFVSIPLAFAVSYARNRDVRWACIHAFFGLPYLAYVGTDLLAEGEEEFVAKAASKVLS